MELIEMRPLLSQATGTGTISALLLVQIEVVDGQPVKLITGDIVEYCLIGDVTKTPSSRMRTGLGRMVSRPVGQEAQYPSWPDPEPD